MTINIDYKNEYENLLSKVDSYLEKVAVKTEQRDATISSTVDSTTSKVEAINKMADKAKQLLARDVVDEETKRQVKVKVALHIAKVAARLLDA